MAEEVLGSRHHSLFKTFALQAAYVSHPHGRDQGRVFTEGLLDAPPALVSRNVQHRRQPLMSAGGPHLNADNGRHGFCQFGLPGAGQADHLREAGSSKGHVAAAAFLVHDGGDTQAGLFHKVALKGVSQPGAVARG